MTSKTSDSRLFPPQHQTIDKGHGRIEIRRIWTSTALKGYIEFPHARQVFVLERIVRERDGRLRSRELAYGVASLHPVKASPARLLALARGHWTIENGIHYVRDWTYREDHCRARTKGGARVMATLRNVAIGLLRLAGARNIAKASGHCGNCPEKALRLMGLKPAA